MEVRLPAGLMVALLAFSVAWSAQESLTQEDVVRLFVQGMDKDALIAKIESSPGDYDVSEDMLDELRIAGIPDEVLQAMVRRQAELRAASEEVAADEPSAGPRLVLRLNPNWKPSGDESLPVLRVLDSIDPETAEQLELRSQDLRITDIGIALMCKTADHVPDHWRSKSPLGRDFRAPRHRLLAFVSGAESSPASKLRNTLGKIMMAPGMRDSLADLNVLTLEIPQDLGVPLEPGVAHDLVLGITLRVGDRTYLVMADEREGVVLTDQEETTLAAVLRGGNKNPLKAQVKFID
ncbi:MAG: hypothetical protein GTN89_07235 [Acidobacteria bacterium]|nr:hypothetical protein [Acidobacteriota bacterium]NIM62977.1 hypothetical protein [Acidobacteriota bacterium]NIO59121.1 hypothetical protein [Acidobacteriota bacterium]NIQ30152.1 hypothetical protein [Acidobacteriota bacterium]NIQ84993.1 hypothetical protein [Acidobacteriota bacterium]